MATKPATRTTATKPAAAKPAAKAAPRAAAKPAPKAAVKPAVKPVAKLAAPRAAAKPAAPKAAARPAAKPAVKAAPKAAAKPAPKAVAKPAPKAAAKPKTTTKPVAAAPEVKKAHKEKLVRDSFTMPEAEYAVLGQVKKAALKAGFEVKKSELLRVGVALISQIDLATLKNVLASLPQLKTGRPKKA
ncbi:MULTISPECIES: hypothetical protein [unclassified Duganella]|uniref:hypothetical protein n=1 Tax=unclassified Duganella TaxID=2636909 RepID=UPI0008927563|nr:MULTISPECIES: hypothetical protein [unclassified Duganella]SDG36126.1 hypothetical protein SAMN05216320_10460 [Duganella sp. OV458]SDJ67305.1 hypothetical protein SAMN05428973_105344 [Duganella sp. OV510]